MTTQATQATQATDHLVGLAAGPAAAQPPSDTMPALVPAAPALDPTMPALDPTMPALDPTMPALDPTMPALDPATPVGPSAGAARAACDAHAATSPEGLYVVSASDGYVGTFPSPSAATDAVARKYPSIPLLVQRFPVAPGPCDRVWVVLYRDLDAVAFVSNARAEAERVREGYARVGLAYLDELDYWEQPFGVVAAHATERLAARHRAHVQCAGPLSDEELQRAAAEDLERSAALCQPKADGPLARLWRENEQITIMDCVIPTFVAAEPEPPAAGATTTASTPAPATATATESATTAAAAMAVWAAELAPITGGAPPACGLGGPS
jgi:hypothetical protein